VRRAMPVQLGVPQLTPRPAPVGPASAAAAGRARGAP
jgi:hypothetical protein